MGKITLNRAYFPENSQKHLPLTGQVGYIQQIICKKIDKVNNSTRFAHIRIINNRK